MLLLCSSVVAQSDSTIQLDQLQVPSSPAFVLLGVAPNSIERPKNPTDFTFALANATNGFTAIPKNFSLEVAPFWLFAKKKPSLSSFISEKPKHSIPQTLVLSVGTNTARSAFDSTEFTQVAVGLSLSIMRGKVGKEYKNWSDSLSMILKKENQTVETWYDKYEVEDIELQRLKSRLDNADHALVLLLDDSINQRTEKLHALAEKAYQNDLIKRTTDLATIKRLASTTDFRRYGFKMDVAAGVVMDYPANTFQQAYLSKAGAWLTMGLEDKPNELNFLALIRFTGQFDYALKNQMGMKVSNIHHSVFDIGFRLYKDFNDKFTLSYELIRRLVSYNNQKFEASNVLPPDNSNRSAFSINYKIGKNQNLSFSFGKDFLQPFLQNDNLITSLSFLSGLGSLRPIGSLK